MEALDSIRCEYFCIGFIGFVFIGKVCQIIPIYCLLMNMKRTIKKYIVTLETNSIKETIMLHLRLRKIDETRNYLVIKPRHLMFIRI